MIGGISFTNNSGGTASAFTLTGNRITLGGDITTTAAAAPLFTDIVNIPILLNGNRTFTTNANHSVSLNGIISETGGAFGFTKTGASALTLGGNNTYTGVTAINVGAIRLTHNNGLGSTVGNTTIAATGSDTTGGRLQLIGTINTSENISISGTTEAGNFTPCIDGATGTISGTITLANPGTSGIRLGAFTAAGNIVQTGTARILYLSGTTVNNPIANGVATLGVINGTATLKGVSGAGIGETQIAQNGNLKLGITDAINTTTDLNIGAFGTTGDTNTFDLASFNQTVRGLIGTNGTRRVINSVESSTSTLTLGNNTNTSSAFTFSGTIQDNNGTGGTVALVKIGTGTQTLSGNNTYSGGTNLQRGILVAGSNTALGTGAITYSGSANGLTLSNGVNIANNITIGANAGVAGAGLIRVANAQTATISGTITINNTAAAGGHFGGFTGNSTGILNITGPINATVTVSHRSSTAIFSGGGSYTQFDTNQGTTRLGANNGLSTTATVNMAGSGPAAFDLAGFNQTLVGITRVINSTSNTATIGNSSTTSDSTLTTTGTSVFNGVIQNTLGGGTRTTALTVASGSLTLSANNTYTGATTIDGGTLTITGATQATTSIAVGSAGKLGLNIASPVTAASAAVTLTGSVEVNGTPTLPSYTLLTASSISGTPVLATPVPGYQLVVEGGNTLKLNTSTGSPYTT